MNTTRFRLVLNKDHSNEKVLVISYSTTDDLVNKLLQQRGKLKGWKVHHELFINKISITQYEKNHVFPNDTLIIICDEVGNLVENKDRKTTTISMADIRFVHQQSSVEPLAMKQLEYTAALPGMTRCFGMPDLHPGGRFPVGAAFLSDTLYPELVGQDIGCGMALWKLDDKRSKWEDVHIKKILKHVNEHSNIKNDPVHVDLTIGKNIDDLDANEVNEFLANHQESLGTIGAGNHFAELQIVEKSYVDTFDDKCSYLLVHSGSRTLGEDVLKQFKTSASESSTSTPSSDPYKKYLFYHDLAVYWARCNRKRISENIAEMCKLSISSQILDICHNSVVPRKEGYLHRKGAAPTDCGLVAIPGSRGDFTYIVRPVDDETIQRECGWSIAHGAGRMHSRSRMADKTKVRKGSRNHDADIMSAPTNLGGHVIYRNVEVLYEEAPEAYKQVSDIIHDLVEIGVIEIVAIMKPVLTFKF